MRVQISDGSSRALAVWTLIRFLVQNAPPAQQAALFRAAARIPGIQRLENAVDADGRASVAVGLRGPRVGRVEMLFDARSHRYLGERIVKADRPDGCCSPGR